MFQMQSCFEKMPDHIATGVIRMTGQHSPELRRDPQRLEKIVDFKANQAVYPRGNLIDVPDKTNARKAA